MKPGPSDLWFWEACYAPPSWAVALMHEKPRAYAPSKRTEHLHAAINARAGYKYPKLALRNALSLLALVRKNQERALTAKYPGQFQDNAELRTLREYMRAHGYGSLNGKAYSLDETRYPYYRRWLRRLEATC